MSDTVRNIEKGSLNPGCRAFATPGVSQPSDNSKRDARSCHKKSGNIPGPGFCDIPNVGIQWFL
jgi:hypothetical protein